jgi:Mrp family chromosome partitioning ATPase
VVRAAASAATSSFGSLERTLDRTIELLSAGPNTREARALLIEARRLRSVIANWRSIPPPADVRDEMVDRVIQLSAAVGAPAPDAAEPEGGDDAPQISLENGAAHDDVYSLDFEPHLYSLEAITTQRQAIPPPAATPRDLGPPLDEAIDFEPDHVLALGASRRDAPDARHAPRGGARRPVAKPISEPPPTEPRGARGGSVMPPAQSYVAPAPAKKSVPPPAAAPAGKLNVAPPAKQSVAPPPAAPVQAPQPITRPSGPPAPSPARQSSKPPPAAAPQPVAAKPSPPPAPPSPPPAPPEPPPEPAPIAARSTPPPPPEPERPSIAEPIPRADLGLDPDIDELGVPRTLVTAEAVKLAEPVSPALVFLTSPYSPKADAYRALRRKLASSGNPRVIGVSSAHAGEGKTTFAVNLALTFRESARGRVLLVEANHRAPAIGKLLGFMPSKCFLDQLTAHLDDPRTPWVAAEPLPKLHVLAIDPRIKREPLLDPVAFGAGMDRLKQAGYEYIVVDAPPILGSVDGNVISDSVEGIIFTALTMKSKRREMRKAVEQLEPAPVLGVVVLET